MKDRLFKLLPIQLQNVAISLVNSNLYRVRHSGKYKEYLKYYKKWDKANQKDIEEEELKRLKLFLRYVKNNSAWYKNKISEEAIRSGDLSSIPILEKNEIVNNFNEIKTLNEKDGIVFRTGGTTGASMKVVYTKENIRERFAIVDRFRAKHGYKLGKKTAWFSGKNLISEQDLKKGRCSHYDFINKIRFYSTFYINNQQNFDIYWNSLNDFKPEFIVGYPSSVYEICRMADSKGLKLSHKVKVFFPTAETLLSEHIEIIGRVMGCKVVNQYASSEGAQFILECTEGNLHIHPLTGVFEVVDENMQPALEGEILVTSFSTRGTPLIRYRIGDRIKLPYNEQPCNCGSLFPLVERIEGRSSDFLYTSEKGKVYIINLIGAGKGENITGLRSWQAVQNCKDKIILKIVATDHFRRIEEEIFISNIQQRLGNAIQIEIQYVDHIPREKSGKFRVIKNNLKLDDL